MKILKKYLPGALVIAMALTIVIGYFNVFYRLEVSFLGVTKSEQVNGYSLLGFKNVFVDEDLSGLSIVFSIIAWLIYVVALGALAIGIVDMVKENKAIRKLTSLIAPIVLVSVGLVYMILAIVCVSVNQERLVESGIAGYSTGSTLGYLPFIFEVVFGAAAIVMGILLPKLENRASAKTQARPATTVAATVTNAYDEEKDKIQMLKQYKELLDMGVISQEEFDAKKAELL